MLRREDLGLPSRLGVEPEGAQRVDPRHGELPFTSRVEVDARLITGQNPQSAKAMGRALVRALA